jgi:bifunctional non-homologous end joining protein LigD
VAKTSFPRWLEPMAATLTQERFASDEWTFERKYDGIRGIAYKQGRDVKLYSRNQLLQHNPAVVAAIAALDAREVILDGELSWREQKNAYDVFDILWLNGRDLTQLTLDERRAILKTLELRPPMRRVAELKGDKPWERACAEGWEGVIAKRRDSKYEHRRSKAWLKMKCEASQELVVGGFTDPLGSRQGFGALLVGYYDGDDFVYAGKVGTGFDTRMLVELRGKFDKIEIPKPPFTKAIGLPKVRAHWVKPQVVVQVSFMEWTGDGKMRHSRLIGIRTDKKARDVVRESP